MIHYSVKFFGKPSKADLKNLLEEQLKQYIGIIFRTAVKLSPVYSGAFRASWRVALNEPDETVSQGGSPENPALGAEFVWPTTYRFGDSIIVSNNQPYADLIEHGRLSEQAPAGVLKLAVIRANTL
jgi:hypothetical protein